MDVSQLREIVRTPEPSSIERWGVLAPSIHRAFGANALAELGE